MRDGENKFGQGLYRLTELADYEVADRNPDVRGWNVFSADNKLIGKVDELIVDLDAMKVRYLDVMIQDFFIPDPFFATKSRRHQGNSFTGVRIGISQKLIWTVMSKYD